MIHYLGRVELVLKKLESVKMEQEQFLKNFTK